METNLLKKRAKEKIFSSGMIRWKWMKIQKSYDDAAGAQKSIQMGTPSLWRLDIRENSL